MEGKATFKLNHAEDASLQERMQRMYELFRKRETPTIWKRIASIFLKSQRDFGVMMSRLVDEALHEAISVLTQKHTQQELLEFQKTGELNRLVEHQMRQRDSLLVREGVLHNDPESSSKDLINELKVEITEVGQAQTASS